MCLSFDEKLACKFDLNEKQKKKRKEAGKELGG